MLAPSGTEQTDDLFFDGLMLQAARDYDVGLLRPDDNSVCAACTIAFAYNDGWRPSVVRIVFAHRHYTLFCEPDEWPLLIRGRAKAVVHGRDIRGAYAAQLPPTAGDVARFLSSDAAGLLGIDTADDVVLGLSAGLLKFVWGDDAARPRIEAAGGT
jgi:hypothetical protein